MFCPALVPAVLVVTSATMCTSISLLVWKVCVSTRWSRFYRDDQFVALFFFYGSQPQLNRLVFFVLIFISFISLLLASYRFSYIDYLSSV